MSMTFRAKKTKPGPRDDSTIISAASGGVGVAEGLLDLFEGAAFGFGD